MRRSRISIRPSAVTTTGRSAGRPAGRGSASGPDVAPAVGDAETLAPGEACATVRPMCCGEDEALDLPPAVIEMFARYRRLRNEQGFGWGEDALPDLFRWSRFSLLGPAFDEFA